MSEKVIKSQKVNTIVDLYLQIVKEDGVYSVQFIRRDNYPIKTIIWKESYTLKENAINRYDSFL